MDGSHFIVDVLEQKIAVKETKEYIIQEVMVMGCAQLVRMQ